MSRAAAVGGILFFGAVALAACVSVPDASAPAAGIDADGSTGGNGGGQGDGSTGPANAGPGCKSDKDCAGPVPITTPPNCAFQRCLPSGECKLSAVDKDGDGHPTQF